MFPLHDDALSLSEIAWHWSRELPGAAAFDECVDGLLKALWLGELTTGEDQASVKCDEDRRLILLRIVVSLDDHPGLYIIRPRDEVEPKIVDLQDGGALCDLRHRIEWTAENDQAPELAFQKLSSVGLEDYSTDVAPLFLEERVTREAFARFCDENGFQRPKFWFAAKTSLSQASSAAQCKRWLKDKASSGKMPKSKQDCLQDAQERFPGLSERSFNKAWAENAPPESRRAGRRRGT